MSTRRMASAKIRDLRFVILTSLVSPGIEARSLRYRYDTRGQSSKSQTCACGLAFDSLTGSWADRDTARYGWLIPNPAAVAASIVSTTPARYPTWFSCIPTRHLCLFYSRFPMEDYVLGLLPYCGASMSRSVPMSLVGSNGVR